MAQCCAPRDVRQGMDMERNSTARPEIHWEVMDVCDMREELEDNRFDIVVDKSTIDAILCGEDSFLNVARMVKEA